ncbi:hypothetical protein [Runella sp.]|uniref:hypothetical protein n=1 Tax=Runella sp. TaxID=1960881 RepID=UPI003D0E0927
MKRPLIFPIIILFICGLFCQQAKAVSPDFKCDKSAKITKQSFGTLGMVIEYNTGKIRKVYRADGKGLIENYKYPSDTTLLITRNFSDGSVGNTFNVILNKQGFIKKLVTDGYSNAYTYDVSGFRTAVTNTYSDTSLSNNSTFTYTKGNLAQEKNFKKNTLQYTVDYTYYEDKVNKADLVNNQNRPDFYGKFSKNLVKTIKYTYADKTVESYEYTYELNANGFVKSLTEKYTEKTGTIITQTNVYEYVCL